MLSTATFNEYKYKYPLAFSLQKDIEANISVLYRDYNYSEKDYDRILSEFIDSAIKKIVLSNEKTFVYVISEKFPNNLINRKKKKFTDIIEIEGSLLSEKNYIINERVVIGIAVIEVIDTDYLYQLLKRIFDNRRFFIQTINKDEKVSISIENILFDCLFNSINDSNKDYVEKVILSIDKYQKDFKLFCVPYGGFDYGQFAFFCID